MPAYGTKPSPTAVSPGDTKILFNNEVTTAGETSISISRGVIGDADDQGITFMSNKVAFTVEGAYQDVDASYVTIRDINATLTVYFYQTTVDRFKFFRVVATGTTAITVVAMR